MSQRNNPRLRASRRTMLGGALGAGSALALSLTATPAALAQSAGDSLQAILNFAATIERFASTHIYTLLTARRFELTRAEENQAKIILDAELKHLDLALANGGQSTAENFFAPEGTYTSWARFAQVTADVETVCTAIYLAAARRLAELGNARLSATMGQLAANEAQHVSVARDLIGVPLSDNAWLPPLFANPTDAQRVVAPFLTGGQGYTGPLRFPTREQFNAVLGDVRAAAYPTFTNTY